MGVLAVGEEHKDLCARRFSWCRIKVISRLSIWIRTGSCWRDKSKEEDSIGYWQSDHLRMTDECDERRVGEGSG
jgi:hypothetical protein